MDEGDGMSLGHNYPASTGAYDVEEYYGDGTYCEDIHCTHCGELLDHYSISTDEGSYHDDCLTVSIVLELTAVILGLAIALCVVGGLIYLFVHFGLKWSAD